MKRIYLALAIYSTLFFLAVAYMGYELHTTQTETWKSWHVQAGLWTAIFVCFVQSIVFIHLLGTGLGIKRAIDEHGLDESQKRDLYRYKMTAFPPAMLSCIATIVTAVLGGAALTGGSATVHGIAATVALLANLVTFPIVIRQLGDNEQMLRSIERQMNAKAKALEAAAGSQQPQP